MAVVKSDAYGHGLIPVASELERIGVDGFAVADPQEGKTLREHEIQLPILVLGPCLKEEWEEVIEARLCPVISTFQEAQELAVLAQQRKQLVHVHLAIDTGMGREGLSGEAFFREWEKIRKLSWIRVAGLFSHFASSDSDPEATRHQWETFLMYRKKLGLPLGHIANSAAIGSNPAYGQDWARVGLALYGLSPFPSLQSRLRPVLSWKARISLFRWMPPGSPISYGGSYVVTCGERIATVTVGYGDGYPRALSNRAYVLVKGKRCPIRGRITMDELLIDISHIRSVRRGEVVTLLGKSQGEAILASDLAEMAGTIPYEILTGISLRIPRVYRNFSSLTCEFLPPMNSGASLSGCVLERVSKERGG